MSDLPTVGRQLRSLVKSTGELELSLQDAEVQQPGDNEVSADLENGRPSRIARGASICIFSRANLWSTTSKIHGP